MLTDEEKFKVVYDTLCDCNAVDEIRATINKFPFPELEKNILLSRFTNYLLNGEPNPFKCVAEDVSRSIPHVQRLYKEIMIKSYEVLKTLFIKGKS